MEKSANLRFQFARCVAVFSSGRYTYTFNNSKKEFVDYFSGKRGQQPIIGDDDSNSSSFSCLSLHDEVLVCACVHATTMMINRGDEGEGGDNWLVPGGRVLMWLVEECGLSMRSRRWTRLVRALAC